MDKLNREGKDVFGEEENGTESVKITKRLMRERGEIDVMLWLFCSCFVSYRTPWQTSLRLKGHFLFQIKVYPILSYPILGTDKGMQLVDNRVSDPTFKYSG